MTTLSLLGNVSLGIAVPALASALVSINGIVALELPALQADLLAFAAQIAQLTLQIGELQVDIGGLEASIIAQVKLNASVFALLQIGPLAALAQVGAQIHSPQFDIGLALAGPSLIASLQTQLDVGVALGAALALKLGLKVALIATLTAQLGELSIRLGAISVRIGAIQAAAGLSATLGAAAAQAGARVYLYTGKLTDFGPTVTAVLPSITGGIDINAPVWIPIVITDSASTFSGLSIIMKTS